MKINDSKLYGRVIFGYIIVFFIIACISLIFIYQKIKLEDINNKQYQINLVHNKIFVLPLYVNKLSSLSESVFTWNYRDYLEYQRNRLFTDSILQDIKIHCNGFIQIEQVDSLCNMLEQKEYSLLHIMRTIKSKEKSDSLFFESQIPNTNSNEKEERFSWIFWKNRNSSRTILCDRIFRIKEKNKYRS